MTINVVVKCPEGIVIGADSLIQVVREDDSLGAIVPYHRKLFQIGKLPVGIAYNGQSTIAGQPLEDIVAEFGAGLALDKANPQFNLCELVQELRLFVERKLVSSRTRNLELMIGGYSRGNPERRSGEVYTVTWPTGIVRNHFPQDWNYGVKYGGHPEPIQRFISGFDQLTALQLFQRWDDLYAKTRDYVLDEVERSGGTLPEGAREIPRPPAPDVNPWSLLSAYDLTQSENLDNEELLAAIVEESLTTYKPLYGYFSLPMAVNFAWHLMLLAYTASNFLNELPAVGSRLRIAAITRDAGFAWVWDGDPGVSQPL